MRTLALVTICFSMLACDFLGPDVTHAELEVAPYKALCTGEAQLFCLQVREAGETRFTYLYETPADFEFEWGFEYVIVVEERERDEPIADASSIVRRLERVVSRSAVAAGLTFELLVPSAWLESPADGRMGLVNEPIVLECADLDCSELATSAAIAPRLLLMLSFPGAPGSPLEIERWQACPSASGPCPAE